MPNAQSRPQSRILLAAKDVTKVFPGVVALDDVSLSVQPGEVIALVGENGAGKSTLMKLLAGQGSPTSGVIEADAELRVALVQQELCLADNLTAGQNVCLGREPSRWGFVDEHALHRRADEALQRLGADFPARKPLVELSIGQRQLVEIAKALDHGADVLILDEPTSSLSQSESERLLAVLRRLRQDGVAILYVSHRLPEVTSIADRAVVLRDGRHVGTLTGDDLTRPNLVRLMIGRAEGEVALENKTRVQRGPTILTLDGLTTAAWSQAPHSLNVSAGEIVGIAGLVGAGRTELLETLAGLRPATSGSMTLCGTDITECTTRERVDLGLGFVPEDRAAFGLFTGGRVDENLTLASAHQRATARHWIPGGWLRPQVEKREYEARSQRLDVRAASPHVAVDSLSGGNQQKVLVGRWLNRDLKLLLLDEPTRGVDLGAREGIYAVLEDLAQSGAAVVFASSDLEEIRRLSQRTLVMRDGQTAGELQPSEATETAIMNLATGTSA